MVAADTIHDELAAARKQLSRFIMERAEAAAVLIGFRWTADIDAPEAFPDLVKAFEVSMRTGQPLPVSNLNTDIVIYDAPEVNLGFRFWHDVHHVLLDLDFTPPKELELGVWHLEQLEAAGFDRHSIEFKLLEFDVLGQNYLISLIQRFPHDQRRFVERCLEVGLHRGLLEEIR